MGKPARDFDGIPPTQGEPLETTTRRTLEAYFQTDLSDIRVHTNAEVAESANSLDALAYTSGRDIYFAAGMYSPSSTAGQRLLVHEVAHVLQQSSGKEPSIAAKSAHGVKIGAPDDSLEIEAEREAERFVSGAPPHLSDEEQRKRVESGVVQRSIQKYANPSTSLKESSGVIQRQTATGGISEADMAVMRAWLETEGKTPAPGFFTPSTPYDPHNPFNRDFGFPAKPAPRDRFEDVCPNCHQTPQEIREAARRRQEEWKKKQREAAWEGMTRSQKGAELTSQDKTLFADIQTGELTAGQLRLQMFDQALAFKPVASAPGQVSVTAKMRDAWAGAQQTTAVLEALLHASKEELPGDITAPFRGSYQAFYMSLFDLVKRQDIQEEQDRDLLSRFSNLTTPPPCPGACHQPAAAPPSTFGAGNSPFFNSRNSPSFGTPLPGASTNIPISTISATNPGPRMKHLDQAVGRAETAMSRAAWQGVLGDFRWATGRLDEVLRSRVAMDASGKDLLEQLDYTQNVLVRQRDFMEKNPEALKIQAIFYPRNEFVDRNDDKGVKREMAKGIPWLFYLVRTPVTDSRYVPVGFEWQLHDVTAPRRDDGRTLKLKMQLDALQALEVERNLQRQGSSILAMDPPKELFDQLNHRDFFPEGMLYWNYPISGKAGELETTAPATFGDWLIRIGMTIAIISGLVFAPFSAPMLLAVGLGTALTVAGRVSNLMEMKEHGTLTQGDLDRFYWDLSLDIVSALTMGLGRVATVSARAGNLLRAASAARAYLVVRRVQIVMDVVNVGILTHDLVTQYQAIQNSNMTDEQKHAALVQLTVFGMASGFMSVIALRAGVHDWNRRLPLHINVDPGSPSQLVGDLETASEHAANARSSVHPEAKVLHSIDVTHPDTGETHSYALWSDGRITRCSDTPCPVNVQSVVNRLEDLRSRMLSDSAHAEQLQELIGRARRIQAEANEIAETSASALAANQERLLSRTSQLEGEIAGLERGVRGENEASDRLGRDEARMRFGDEALNYDTKKYRWVRKRDGTLEFQRRNLAVPWREFRNGKFEITRSLFEPVTPQRLEEIRATSLTKDFPVEATIDNIADLRRLRPASPYVKPHPGRWVVVRINDDNLVQFITEPVAHGVIFEFPDGSRVWRTPQNTIATEGALRGSIGRRGFEQTMLPQLRTTDGESNLGFPVVESTGVEHQRAHPRGQGTGFELMNHIPLAPTYVNQELQARGIELFLRELRRLHPNVDFRLATEHAVFPGTLRQSKIDYHILVVSAKRTRPIASVRIGTDYSDVLKPAEVEMRFLTKNEEDLALLDEVNMPEALQTMEDRIRAARQQRGTR
jgi:hypothetical protein